MFFNVLQAEYIGDYNIRLTFSNGKSGVVDLKNYIGDGEIFKDIRTLDNFKRFTVEFGTLVWMNGEVDIAPETLYEKTTGERVEFKPDQVYRAV